MQGVDPRPIDRPLLIVTSALLIAIGGCSEALPEDKPTPPDLSQTVAAFSSPRAPLNAETLQQALENLDAQFSLIELLDLDGFVIDTVLGGIEAEEDSKPQGLQRGELRVARKGLELSGEGFLEVTRICDGWGPEPVADTDNGSMQFIVPFTDNGLDPVLWGEFSGCKYTSNDQEILLQPGSRGKVGDVRLFIGDNISIGGFGKSPIIFEIDLQHALGGEGFLEDTRINFRVQPDGILELLLPVDEGELVASVVGETLGFRASNGDWVCNLGQGRCDSGDNESFNFLF